MRVNPDHSHGMLSALQRVSASESTALQQLSSGRRIQRPSDDPAGMAALVQVQAKDAATTQYLSAIKAVRSQMQAADSSLNSAVLAMERALTLGVRGATGTLSDSDRQSIAAEIDGIGSQLLEIANSSIHGVYLFSGTSTTTRPFASVGSAVFYQGSDDVNNVAIGEGFAIAVNLPGQSVFGTDDTGLFASITNLAQTIRNGSDVDAAIDPLRQGRDQLSGARVAYGNALNQLDSSELVLSQRHLQLAQQETDLAGIDLAEVATNLSTAESARNALLATLSKGNGVNLFDYLR